MRFIYDQLSHAGATMVALADRLNEMEVPPPKKSSFWDAGLLSKMVKNPVYKGEFVAHRWYYDKVWSDKLRRTVTRKFQRPSSEWIIAPVPAIVSEHTWEAAQAALVRNRSQCTRNVRYPYLLVNLVTCAECGHRFCSNTKLHHKKGKTYLSPTYRCTSRGNRARAVREHIGCTQSQISAHTLDPIVWEAILDVLTTPEMLTEAMDQYHKDGGIDRTRSQVELVDQQIQQRDREDERLYRAYLKGAFDEEEFSARRQELKDSKQALEREKKTLSDQLMSHEELGKRKDAVADMVDGLRETLRSASVPFEVKRSIVTLIVDDIQLNVNEGWFKLAGVLRGTFAISDGRVVSIPGDRGSWPR